MAFRILNDREKLNKYRGSEFAEMRDRVLHVFWNVHSPVAVDNTQDYYTADQILTDILRDKPITGMDDVAGVLAVLVVDKFLFHEAVDGSIRFRVTKKAFNYLKNQRERYKK